MKTIFTARKQNKNILENDFHCKTKVRQRCQHPEMRNWISPFQMTKVKNILKFDVQKKKSNVYFCHYLVQSKSLKCTNEILNYRVCYISKIMIFN